VARALSQGRGINLNFQRVVEEIHVMGSNLVDKVKELIHEGNVQRIIIKNEQGQTIVEIPVTLAAIGVVAAPELAAVGAIAGFVTKCTLVSQDARNRGPERGYGGGRDWAGLSRRAFGKPPFRVDIVLTQIVLNQDSRAMRVGSASKEGPRRSLARWPSLRIVGWSRFRSVLQ
jgi:hypothetical protein